MQRVIPYTYSLLYLLGEERWGGRVIPRRKRRRRLARAGPLVPLLQRVESISTSKQVSK